LEEAPFQPNRRKNCGTQIALKIDGISALILLPDCYPNFGQQWRRVADVGNLNPIFVSKMADVGRF
jgi:hypothetical protein